MQENRMFRQMMLAARERLTGRDAEEIARLSGCEYDAGSLHLTSLGKKITVRFPECSVEGADEGWHCLLILHYLDFADGAALERRLIPFSQMKDGMVRGGGFDADFEAGMQALMERISEEELERRCIAMGGRIAESNADFTAVLPFLPRCPVTLKLWLADEEFPASGRLMADAGIDHYLTIEDAVTMGAILLERLSV